MGNLGRVLLGQSLEEFLKLNVVGEEEYRRELTSHARIFESEARAL